MGRGCSLYFNVSLFREKQDYGVLRLYLAASVERER